MYLCLYVCVRDIHINIYLLDSLGSFLRKMTEMYSFWLKLEKGWTT